jgi:hypothetical protein
MSAVSATRDDDGSTDYPGSEQPDHVTLLLCGERRYPGRRDPSRQGKFARHRAIVSFSSGAVIANNEPGTAAGISATPANDATNYMSILGGHSETLAFARVKSSFGLYWGSIDTYNELEFFSGNSATAFATCFGNPLNAVPPVGSNGDQFVLSANAYIVFSGLSFDRIMLSSSTNSFLTTCLPMGKPPGWRCAGAMLILGFAGMV